MRRNHCGDESGARECTGIRAWGGTVVMRGGRVHESALGLLERTGIKGVHSDA